MININNAIIDMVIKRRKCNLDPKALLRIDEQTNRFYWDSAALILWADVWCEENGLSLRIETHVLPTEDQGAIPCSAYEGGKAIIKMASVQAEVWYDKVENNKIVSSNLVSTATACGTYVVNDKMSSDTIFNKLRKNAIGNAISQAGFGIMTGFDMTKEDIEQLQAAGMLPTEGQTADLPFTMADTLAESQAAQDGVPKSYSAFKTDPFGFGCDDSSDNNSFLSAPAAANVIKRPPMPPVQSGKGLVGATSNEGAPEAVPDEMIRWPGQGWAYGKALGEILSGPSGIKKLTTMMNIDANGDEKILAAQAAIRRILENRQK